MTSSITLMQEVKAGNALATLLCSDDIMTLKLKEGDYLQADIKVISGPKRKRSALMNRATHKYCSNIAESFNTYGIEQVVGIADANGKRIEMMRPWTMQAIKEDIFQVQLLAVTDGRTHHSSEATDGELCKVDEAIGKMIAENFGIVIEWPSLEGQKAEAYNNEA